MVQQQKYIEIMERKETLNRDHLRVCRLLFAAGVVAVCVVLVLCVMATHLGEDLAPVEKKRIPVPYMNTTTENERKIRQKEKQFRRNQALFAVRNSTSKVQPRNKCLSIFSLGGVRPEMSNSTLYSLGYLRALKTSKRRKLFLRQEAYSVLSYEFPPMEPVEKNRSELINATSSRGRLEKLKGQLPHMPCRLREYSAAQLRQCVVNRRRHGRATKALFIGDSRIRQIVEVFLDVFRDLKFQVSTFEGISIGVDDFLSEDADFLWTKYKREFEARSTELPDLSVGFYWTSLMGVKTKLLFLEPKENPEIFSSTYKRFQERLWHQTSPFNLKTIFHKFRNTSNEDAQHTSVSSTTFTSPYQEASSKLSTHFENSTHPQPPLNSRREVVPSYDQESKVFKSEPIERLRNISRMAKNEVPDIIFLGTGVWSLNHQYGFLKVLDEVTLDQIELLRPVLRDVARKTDAVWVMAPPISDNVFYKPTVGNTLRSYVFNKYQEWITSAQTQAFNSEGIPVWDSLQPVAEASIRDCSALNGSTELPEHPRLLHRRSWDCGDRVHSNNEAVVVAVDMIVNYLCNEYLPPGDYCCHQSP